MNARVLQIACINADKKATELQLLETEAMQKREALDSLVKMIEDTGKQSSQLTGVPFDNPPSPRWTSSLPTALPHAWHFCHRALFTSSPSNAPPFSHGTLMKRSPLNVCLQQKLP